jgi:hypothetical protein
MLGFDPEKMSLQRLGQIDGKHRHTILPPFEGVGALMSDYQLRFVVTWNQLCEKNRIFEASIDDTQVEFIKVVIADKAFGHVDFGDDTIYFAEKHKKLLGGGGLRFEIYQNGRLASTREFPLTEYEKIAESMRQQLAAITVRGNGKQ